MAKEKSQSCSSDAPGCCRVEAVVGVDERGQMVLPKELRERFAIRAGDKLALATWDAAGEPCCIVLMKADRLAGMVREMLGPVLKDI
jgi:antitoxin PrlF